MGRIRASISWTFGGTKIRPRYYTSEGAQENSHSGSGVGERATGTVKALTERAPTTRKVRVAFGNMMIGRADNNGTRPEVRKVG